jgi:sulfite exporter TauE/SafE
MTALLAGLVFGLVGSGHCAAMCGPLVLLANPRPSAREGMGEPSPARLAVHAALYHGGRACTYLALGMLAGIAGGAMARLGLGRALAIAAGVALVLQAVAATSVLRARLGSVGVAAAVTRALGRVGIWMRAHQVQGPLLFGALNGLLPCGLLYAALVAAAGFGDFRESLLFMAAFSIGTTPILGVVALAGGALTTRIPPMMRRSAPVALALVGVLLIARGVRTPHGGHVMPTTLASAPEPATAPASHGH